MYNSMFTGRVYKNVPFPTKNAPKWFHANLPKVTKSMEGKSLKKLLNAIKVG